MIDPETVQAGIAGSCMKLDGGDFVQRTASAMQNTKVYNVTGGDVSESWEISMSKFRKFVDITLR